MTKRQMLEAIYLKGYKSGTTIEQLLVKKPELEDMIKKGLKRNSTAKIKNFYERVVIGNEPCMYTYLFYTLCCSNK